eukprot:GGOE01013780.1.p2 GENE.GGOE01013780.1~~GGOE01013780.1.p2  ORF type:complete len:139 (+),score=52.21 GGOE01013780.1:28-417(+)
MFCLHMSSRSMQVFAVGLVLLLLMPATATPEMIVTEEDRDPQQQQAETVYSSHPEVTIEREDDGPEILADDGYEQFDAGGEFFDGDLSQILQQVFGGSFGAFDEEAFVDDDEFGGQWQPSAWDDEGQGD